MKYIIEVDFTCVLLTFFMRLPEIFKLHARLGSYFYWTAPSRASSHHWSCFFALVCHGSRPGQGEGKDELNTVACSESWRSGSWGEAKTICKHQMTSASWDLSDLLPCECPPDAFCIRLWIRTFGIIWGCLRLSGWLGRWVSIACAGARDDKHPEMSKTVPREEKLSYPKH